MKENALSIKTARNNLFQWCKCLVQWILKMDKSCFSFDWRFDFKQISLKQTPVDWATTPPSISHSVNTGTVRTSPYPIPKDLCRPSSAGSDLVRGLWCTYTALLPFSDDRLIQNTPLLLCCHDMHQAPLDDDDDDDDVTTEATARKRVRQDRDEILTVPFIWVWHADPQKAQQD